MRIIHPSQTKICNPDKHRKRDNKFGITWCVDCGCLFNKPSGKELQNEDKLLIKI